MVVKSQKKIFLLSSPPDAKRVVSVCRTISPDGETPPTQGKEVCRKHSNKVICPALLKAAARLRRGTGGLQEA